MRFSIFSSFILLSSILLANLTAQDMSQQFDNLVSEYYSPNAPGAAILVAKDGKAIYRKAIGKASLELDVDLNTENVFRLASISKQFTAVSILMLEEQGKLSLNDPITKFIPDYPTQGKTITIHHLLNHTSGIKSYTSMGNLVEFARADKTTEELVNYFKNEPMDFDPGEAYRYNNSGYVLLGYIIEIITEDSYENFVEKNIFEPLKMTSSRYGNNIELVKNRAQGYEKFNDGYTNANFISMSIPHAAGSLTSTVDDMFKWQLALSNNTLIKEETFQKAINGSDLNNGDHIDYGYGLSEFNLKGSKGYTHSGGIFGFNTNGIYLIEDDVYVIGLSNCACNDISSLTRKLAATAIGKPFPTMDDVISLNKEQLKKWIGAYEFEDGAIRHIFIEDGKLKSMRESENNTVYEIFPLSENRFMFAEGDIEYQFSTSADGKRTVTFSAQSQVKGFESNKPLPELKKEVAVAKDILINYVGTYELAQNFLVEISLEDNHLHAQATGQGKFQLFAENETDFFAKVTPISITFNKNEDDGVESFTLLQGGQEMIAKKIE